MSYHEALVPCSGWKHPHRPSRAKSRETIFSGLPWTPEATAIAEAMAAREIVGDALMLAAMREIEPNRAWTMNMIRGKIFRIRKGK
jgi:hypothetical protein